MAERLTLPEVTLCAATSVNIAATLAALSATMEQVFFGDAVLFTDSVPPIVPDGLRIAPTPRIESSRAYSEFILDGLVDHISTDYCLIVQWDGFVIDSRQWDSGFLEFDYVGAPWPQFADGHDIGNGGFSLRSRRLLEACRSRGFIRSHPEDVAIGRINRSMLERDHGIRFATREAAERFAFERTLPIGPTFGFHGIFNMIPTLGDSQFWQVYDSLDHRHLNGSDFWLLVRQLARRRNGATRILRLALDRAKSLAGPRKNQA